MGQQMDRRMYKRFKVQEASFAFIEKDVKILCKLKNIGRGGVSLITVANAEQIPEIFDMDIFVSGRVFYLKNLPAKKISEVAVNHTSFVNAFSKSQIGIEFGELTDSQVSRLEDFIQDYGTIEDLSEIRGVYMT
jgi:hypothetical protein